jgi:hypothetical protein
MLEWRGGMAVEKSRGDPYMEHKKDLDQMRKLFRRLHLRKEQEITIRRLGKRMAASQVKEMREMETTIEALMERRRGTVNALQRNLLDNFRNEYLAQMRSWKNRLSFAERQLLRRPRPQRSTGSS